MNRSGMLLPTAMMVMPDIISCTPVITLNRAMADMTRWTRRSSHTKLPINVKVRKN